MSSRNSLLGSDVASYPALFRRVKETLLEGQRRVESEKVRTYWETGRLIQTHILGSGRAEYGAEVYNRLSADLGTDKSTLQRCVQFYKAYPGFPIDGGRHQFSWMHYRKLITVADGRERARLESLAGKSGWSAEELAAQIRSGRAADNVNTADVRQQTAGEAAAGTHSAVAPLVPLRGELYTYKIKQPAALAPSAESSLVVDLGFSVTRNVGQRVVSNFSAGDIVQSIARDEAYRFSKADRTARDLYTYRAYVERVIDGDTLKARVDLGFDTWTDQTLRLRGIDCPELKTQEGAAAKAFVQSLLKEADRIVIHSSRSDKYDRYLADIFIPAVEGGADVFLNALLIEKGFAVRWEG